MAERYSQVETKTNEIGCGGAKLRKIRIGILTWYYAMNHGARAHTYALLHTLRKMGYEAEIIAYKPWRSYKDIERYWFVTRNIPLMLEKFKYRLSFKLTEKDYKFLSRKVRSAKEIDNLGYDLIILGSDEIFNIKHLITSKDYTYFGVGIEKTSMITYAVSCGQSEEKVQWPMEVINSVKRIKALSVRDVNSQRIIEANTGRKAELVLDPTLLFDFSSLADKDWSYRDYILIYAFGFIDDYKEQIINYAKEYSKKIICVGNKYEWADVNIKYPSQYQWYAAFEHASLVITNSFHGTIFALKNNKPFVIIFMDDKVTKISNLLEQLGIKYEEHLLTRKNSVKECLKNPLVFGDINLKIEKEYNISINYVRKGLASV